MIQGSPSGSVNRKMADFDAINTIERDEEDNSSSSLESYTQTPEPVIIRGAGNITVYV